MIYVDYMHLLILSLHNLDGMNLLSMFLKGCCILKSLSTQGTSNRYLQMLTDMCQHTVPVCVLECTQLTLGNPCDPQWQFIHSCRAYMGIANSGTTMIGRWED